jgi:alpha-L-arabinofuranosidase
MPTPARVYIDPLRTVGEISPLLFGGFAEHMGRCIYGGIYEPTSPHADERGFRKDVLAALKELDFSVIRYPGGNFLSGYHWQDGVGPRASRPRRRELAWHSIETNQFGTNEFIEYCRELGTQPLLGTNFGTGSIEESAALVEYCNAPAGSYYADLRVSHGYPQPYGIKYWCLGNEMDGPWQIGHLEAEEYARKAREAAKMMKWHDPSIQLSLCGSSSLWMRTFPDWDRIALETCWEQADYLSCHLYVGNRENDTANYLGVSSLIEEQVDVLAATLRYVKNKLRSKHDVYLSWDEWNVWYKNQEMDGHWTEAPHLIEEIYNLEDALVVAEWLNIFLRHCDVLKMACLAQIVNVIAPILTTPDQLVKQTIFYPFKLYRQFAHGSALDVLVQAPLYTSNNYGDLPLLDASASYDPESGQSAVFLVNRSLKESLPVEVVWQGKSPKLFNEVYQLGGTDPKAANTFSNPNTVVPTTHPAVAVNDGIAQVTLPPLSLTVLAAK